jgi:hypothetical protein
MQKVPTSLRYWFLAHFVIDFVFAIPLLVAPLWTLGLFGFETTTSEAVLFARLVGAALIGIGGASLFMHKKGMETYSSMLTLKILWSSAAMVAIGISVFEGSAPEEALWFLRIFIIFNAIWIYYKVRENR